MRYILKGTGFVFLMIVVASCGGFHHSKSHASLPGTWQSQPVVIDGDSKDWPSPYPNYDSKGRVAYATSNDAENLYITMETGDEMTQMKILKQGMVVSIDTGGKKSPDFNISFPLQSDIDLADLPRMEHGEPKEGMRYEDKQREQRISRYAKEANQFSTDGFIRCNGVFMAKQITPCGISVSMSIDEYKELVWEAVVPFKAIYNKDKISAADAGKPISVCFSVKAFKKSGPKNSGGDEGSGGSGNTGMAGAGSNSSMHNMGGGRGGRGGGKGGRGSMQGEDPMMHLYENTKTWKFFGIAYQ